MPGNTELFNVNLSLFPNASKANTPALCIYRSQVLGYPPNAVLELEDFHGLDAESNVITMLRNDALAGGTVLVVGTVVKEQRCILFNLYCQMKCSD